jgi:RNA polymerase sigma factor (sigma-70 family)
MTDNKQFEELARRLRPKIIRMGKAILAGKADAEDVAQESLLRLWLLRERAKSGKAEALALVIARNICISLLRRKARTLPTETMDKVLKETSYSDPQSEMEEAEDAFWFQQQMEGLPPGEFAILRMKDAEGLSIREIAAMLDISENAVKLRLSRARRKLYEQYKERNKR